MTLLKDHTGSKYYLIITTLITSIKNNFTKYFVVVITLKIINENY